MAVVEPAEEGTSAPTAIAGLPGPSTTAERKAALTDTAAQVSQASDDLERTQGGEADRVLGVIPAPFAEDKLGNPVATSLAVEGSEVTMEVLHGVSSAYPVVAGHGYVSRDAVDEYETLRAAASIGDYAWGEGSEPAPSPTPVGTSAEPPTDEPEEGLEDDGLAGGGDDDPADGPVVVGAGGREASSEPKRADAGECDSNAEELRREPFFCPLSEFGLLGANDDDLYAKSTETGTPDFVIPKGGRGPIAPNNNRYSYRGERRFAFCLLRDRRPSEVRRPARINRASCPAGPS